MTRGKAKVPGIFSLPAAAAPPRTLRPRAWLLALAIFAEAAWLGFLIVLALGR